MKYPQLDDIGVRYVQVGPCLLINADALELLDRKALRWDAILSDPPYGINIKDPGKGAAGAFVRGVAHRSVAGDDKPFDPAPWLVGRKRAVRGTRQSVTNVKPLCLWGAEHYKNALPPGGSLLVWDKSTGQGPAVSFCDAEFAWCDRRVARNVFRHFWMGGLRAGDPLLNSRKQRLHLSQKPVELMAWCLDAMRVGVGKTVCDPYMGSGTTGIASALSGRRFVGVEINPEIFDIAVERVTTVLSARGLIAGAAP